MINQDREILKPLIDKIEFLSEIPEQEIKKKRWANHQSMKKTDRTPISVYYEGIPAQQWIHMFGDNFLLCKTDTGKEIEFNLRKTIWMAENVNDDHIVWSIVKLMVPYLEKQGWGICIDSVESEEELGANALAAPFKDGIDIAKLKVPEWEIDKILWKEKLEMAVELIDSRLEIYPYYFMLDFSPFDIATNMRGLEAIMFDPFDNPDKLHQLMEFITSSLIKHHFKREKEGLVNFMVDKTGKYQIILEHRVHCNYSPKNINSEKTPKLCYEWPYISAQTSSGFGPDMYNEFVHKYNCSLASLFNGGNVYYHGCEPLNQKVSIIKNLPNLKRFHVSPWTSLSKIVNELQGSKIMEVHSHPGKVLMGWGKEDIRKEIKRLFEESEGHSMDLNLSDIHTLNEKPEILSIWAEIAKEEAERYS